MTAPAGPEIWVTGLAWTTPLGDTLDGVWGRLLAGDTGLDPTPSAHQLRTERAGVGDQTPCCPCDPHAAPPPPRAFDGGIEARKYLNI